MLLVALKRINGRLERAQMAGKHRTLSPLHAEQDLVAQLCSSVAHYTDCSPAERNRMTQVIGDVNSLSDDDESPQHGLGEDEKNHTLVE